MSDKKREQLKVEPSGKDDKFLYFTTKTPEFSPFAITGTVKKASDETMTEKQTKPEIGVVKQNDVNQNGTGNEGTEAEQKEIPPTPGFKIGLGIACILLACSFISGSAKAEFQSSIVNSR